MAQIFKCRASFVVFVLILAVSFSSAPALEEELQWGQNIFQVTTALTNKKKEFYLNDEQSKIVYPEKVFKESCDIVLHFNPSKKTLYKIQMIWGKTAVGERIRSLLKDGYGPFFTLPQESSDFYVWSRTEERGLITLDYRDGETVLTYYGVGEHAEEKELMAAFQADVPAQERADENPIPAPAETK